jgi:hypothetical protein
MGEQRTALSLLMIFCSVLIGIENLMVVNAESTGYIRYSSGVTLFSPLNITYSSNIMYLNLTFDQGAGIDCSLNYSIDGNYKGSIPLVTEDTGFHIIYKMTGLVALPELSEGSHNLTIDVLCGLYDYHGANPPGAPFAPTSLGSSNYIATWTHIIYFTINTYIPELPSWIILPLFLVATLFGVIIRKRVRLLKVEKNLRCCFHNQV